MSASRAADGSVLRTGLSQFALSIAAFGTLAAGAIGAAFFFGDDDAGGPAKPAPDNLHFQVGAFLVGVAGFEPTTSCSRSKRSTRLSYTPTERGL